MSKLRQDITITDGEIATPEEGDLAPYVVFTQLRQGGPFVYAGWLDAADDTMALHFACEHYGQDQKCVRVCTIARSDIAGTEELFPVPDDKADVRPFRVFRQKVSGMPCESVTSVEADSSAAALGAARALGELGAWSSLWVADQARIITSDEDDVVWRFTDQSYRLARGYSASVREKWEKVRAERDIVEYEKEDLEESF